MYVCVCVSPLVSAVMIAIHPHLSYSLTPWCLHSSVSLGLFPSLPCPHHDTLSRVVSYEEGAKFAKTNDLIFLETSAKTADNVEEVRLLAQSTSCTATQTPPQLHKHHTHASHPPKHHSHTLHNTAANRHSHHSHHHN